MKYRIFTAFSIHLLVLGVLSWNAGAAEMVNSGTLLSPTTPERYNQFGAAVDISPDGGSAIVGEHKETFSDGDGGVAYFFSSLTSSGQQLPPGDLLPQTAFGRAVALADNGLTAVIGAPWNDIGDTGSQGAAYIYTIDGGKWSLPQKVVDLDGGEYEYFGDSVDIADDGNTIIVGNPGDPDASGVGAAHIFVRSGANWVLQKKLKANDGKVLDFFGSSVALSGDGNIALVGAPFDNGDQGSVYVYTKSSGQWRQQTRFTGSGSSPGDKFGTSVDLSDDGSIALVGAYWWGNQRGAAAVFTNNGSGWSQQGFLQAPDGADGDWFGNVVALNNDGNIAVVGAVGANAAYLFTRLQSTWSFQEKLSSTDPNTSALGTSVALSDDGKTVLVGDDEYTVSGELAQGAVFIYQPFISLPGLPLLLLDSP